MTFITAPLPSVRPRLNHPGMSLGLTLGKGLVTLENALAASNREATGRMLAGGSAAAQPRLRLFAKCAFEQRFIANSPARPGSARPCEGVRPPLAARPPLNAGTAGHSPPALSRLPTFAESRDQPPVEPSFFDSVSRRWTRLEFLGVGHGSRPCPATAQQPKQGGLAGAPPPFGSAWGQGRWSCGRPSHRLGPMVPGSFTSDRGIHVNRIGGRFAGAHLTA